MAEKLGTGIKRGEDMEKTLKNIGYSMLFFLFLMGCYRLVKLTGLEKQPEYIKAGMLLIFLLLLVYLAVCARKGTLTTEKKIACVILYGIVMRVGYTLCTGCTVRSHDLGEISRDGSKHAAYLLNLLETGKLPDSNRGQFYQQPFFYLAGSAVSRFVNRTLIYASSYDLVDAAKLVSCFASCMTLLATERICRFFQLEDKGRLLAVSLTAFLPAMYLTGGRVNCDACHTLFSLLAFYYTCRWYREQSWKNILVLALIYGFGMMNKISMGIMAIFTAVVFLYLFWKTENPKYLAEQVKKYAVFAMISLPLGLWYVVRNAVRFGQSPLYVLDLASVPEIYCGNYSLVQRFVSWNLKNLFATPYADPWSDYNLPVYQIKTALFGEFTYEINDWIPALLLFSAVVLVLMLVPAFCQIIKNRKEEGFLFWTVLAFLLWYGSSLWFAYQYPYGCSMDFRYVVILGVFAAILLGRYLDCRPRAEQYLLTASSVFCICSCAMYLWII